jgi:hypothetical protein
VQFKDLEAMVVSQVTREQVQFAHRIEFAKATDATTFTEISVSLPSNQPILPNDIAKSLTEFEVFGRVSKPSGWVVDTFERKISLTAQNNSGHFQPDSQFQLALTPGPYRLAIVAKDLASGDTGTSLTKPAALRVIRNFFSSICTHPSDTLVVALGAVCTMLLTALSPILNFTRLKRSWLRRRPRPLSAEILYMKHESRP